MVTTIQLSENVKEELRALKIRKNDSYEEVIIRLLEKSGSKKKKDDLLKEGYIETNEEDSLTGDWNRIDEGWD